MKKDLSVSKRNLIIIAVIVTAVSVLIRATGFDYVTGDFTYYLSEWMNELEKVKGFRAFGVDIGNYTPPYLYILAAITKLPVNRLYAVKIVSCVFDYLLALGCSLVTYELTRDRTKQLLAYSLTILCPTVMLDSAYWAQCDCLYVTFLVFSFLYILKDKPYISCIFFGLSFAFKLQSIFFAPIFIVLFFRKKIKIRHMFMIPAVYVLLILPSVIAGRGFINALTVYLHQTESHKKIDMNAPNLWGLLFGDLSMTFISCLAVAAVLVMCFIIYRRSSSTSGKCALLVPPVIIPGLIAGQGRISSMAAKFGGNTLSINPQQIRRYIAVYGTPVLSIFAILLAGFAVLAILFVCLKKCREFNAGTYADMVLLFALIIPFLLPRMHDRYFFLADVMSICYALRYPKRFFVPILIVSASLYAYLGYLFRDITLVQLPIASVIMFCAVVLVFFLFYKDHIGSFGFKKKQSSSK